jgi:acylphosphatase
MEESVRRYFISGKVQGVGFRYWVVGRARLLGLTGWVRNCQDGRVEVLARGVPVGLDALGNELWQGPVSARVEKVEPGIVTVAESRGLSREDFVQGPTV